MLIDGCPRYLPLFGASYVVICHLEVKLLKYNYKNFVKFDEYFWWIIALDALTSSYIDGHESKPAISILAIVQESRKTSAFRYFSSYSFYFIT